MDATQVAAAAEQAAGTTPPQIGQYWAGHGGIYVGLAAADGDLPQAHLVLALETSDERFTWKEAQVWAAGITADGHAMRLMTRFEAALIYANARAHVDTDPWYWTASSYSESVAWGCYFFNGHQGSYRKSSAGSARAVRRFVL